MFELILSAEGKLCLRKRDYTPDTGILKIVTKVCFGAAHSDAFQGVIFNLGYGSFPPLMLASRFWGLCSLNSLEYLNSFFRCVGGVLIIYMFVLQLEATISILTWSISFYRQGTSTGLRFSRQCCSLLTFAIFCCFSLLLELRAASVGSVFPWHTTCERIVRRSV